MDSGTTGLQGIAASALLAFLLNGCAAPGAVVDSGYTPGPAYHLIMAEIAASRGVQATAAREYLNAAESSDDAESSKRAAAFAFEFGFDAYALRAARRWAQLAPEDTTAQLYLARLLIRRNDVPAATAAAERALGEAKARTETDYLLLAGEIDREDNVEAVTMVMTRVADTAPQSGALQLSLATAALRSKDFDLALESAHEALARTAISEIAVEANLLIGRALLARGDGAAAIEHMSRQVEASPTLEVELEYARLLAADGRTAQALATLDDLAARYGPEPAIERLQALVNLDAGDRDAALKYFGELLQQGEFAGESLFYAAGIAEQQGHLDEALELYGNIADGAFLLPARVGMARIAERRGDAESALQQLAEFAGRHPQLAFMIHRHQVTILDRMGRQQEALDLLNYDLAYRPDDVDLLLSRGALFEKLGQLDPALADLNAAVAVMPNYPVALNALGYTLVNLTGHHEEGYRLVRRALEREPNNAAILDSYGWAWYRLGKLPEARSYLQLAYTNFPDAEVAAHLGEVMWKQGDRDAASTLWRDALEKNPSSKPLRETMARFLPEEQPEGPRS